MKKIQAWLVMTGVLMLVFMVIDAKPSMAASYVYSGTVSFTYYLDSGEPGKQLSKNIVLTYNAADNKSGYNIYKGNVTAPASANFFITNKKGIAQIEPSPGNSIVRLPYFTAKTPDITGGTYKTAALNVVRNGVFVIYDAQNDIYIKLRVSNISRAFRKLAPEIKKSMNIPVSIPASPSAQPVSNDQSVYPALTPVVLPAPRFVTPYNNQVVNAAVGGDRKLDPVWTAVSGAHSYIIETEYKHCIDSITREDCWGSYGTPYRIAAAETNQGDTNIFKHFFLGADGTYRVRIRTSDYTNTLGPWSDYVVFKVDTSVVPIAAPQISLPVPGQVLTNANRMIDLNWGWVQGATRYQVITECTNQYGIAGYTSVSEINTVEGIPLYNVSFSIQYDGTCRTRARGYSMSGFWGPWSDYVNFSVNTSGSQPATVLNTQPVITTPMAGTAFSGDGYVRVAWTRADGAVRYQVNLSCETCPANDPWWNIKDATDLFVLTPVSNFAPGVQTYTAMVTPIKANNYDGTPSEKVTFTVQR